MNILRTSSIATIAVALLFGLSSCSENTVQPTVTLGKTTLSEFLTNAGYAAWYNVGYDAFPATADDAAFDAAVSRISARLNAGEGDYTMLLVVKPTCGCEHTQSEMPKVMKTLDEAGFNHDNIEVWITDRPLNGIDDIKDVYQITAAPTFLLVKDDVEMGRIVVEEISVGAEISTSLADIFES